MKDYEELTRKQALKVFKNNEELIFNSWIILSLENEKVEDEFDDLIDIFNDILVNYISYLNNEDEKLYKSSIIEIVRKMDINDISYSAFLATVPYFQESYVNVLLKNLKYKDAGRCLTLCNRIYNKTVAIIRSEYLNIKDPTLTAMIKLSELRDDITGYHIERTKEYAVLLSRELNLDDKFVKHISKASLLHDIGKVAIRDEVLLKPGKLTKDEYKEIKQHATIGAKTINKVITANEYINEYLYMAIDIALCHHEKYDGSGYPNGLSESKIPLCARIFAIADAYDVITSKRPYKEPESHEEAVRRIKLDCGKHFDPDIVEAFLRIQDNFEVISKKYKDKELSEI